MSSLSPIQHPSSSLSMSPISCLPSHILHVPHPILSYPPCSPFHVSILWPPFHVPSPMSLLSAIPCPPSPIHHIPLPPFHVPHPISPISPIPCPQLHVPSHWSTTSMPSIPCSPFHIPSLSLPQPHIPTPFSVVSPQCHRGPTKVTVPPAASLLMMGRPGGHGRSQSGGGASQTPHLNSTS